jgi:hypothetical protein
MKIGEMEAFMRTWSAVHVWCEARPCDLSMADRGNREVIDKMMADLRGSEVSWKELSKAEWKEVDIEVEWGGALILTRRR